MDLRQYQLEFYKQTKGFSGQNIINHYQLPNKEELHTMIYGYGNYLDDKIIYDLSESVDYFNYERHLWRDWRKI